LTSFKTAHHFLKRTSAFLSHTGCAVAIFESIWGQNSIKKGYKAKIYLTQNFLYHHAFNRFQLDERHRSAKCTVADGLGAGDVLEMTRVFSSNPAALWSQPQEPPRKLRCHI
jgi:hypothetical protein